jgi:pyruvate,orthophosphate dikinase
MAHGHFFALDLEASERMAQAGTLNHPCAKRDHHHFEGMALSVGILTASGGRTSHAAIVAREARWGIRKATQLSI